jgi:hypothetical protein
MEKEFCTYYTETILQSEEKDFLDNLEQMLLVPEIKRTIENLYHQSKENIYRNESSLHK